MKQEIKERVEKIQKGEVPEGYRKTKVTIIPEDWDWGYLGDNIKEMTDFVAAGSFESLRNNVKVYNNPNYALYVRLVDLRSGLGHPKQKYVDINSYKFLSKSNLYGNELLIANIGANVGETFLMLKNLGPATIAPNMIVVRADNSLLRHDFLYQFIQSKFGQEKMHELIAGSGHPKINKTDMKKYKIVLPKNNEEQQKIAEILSTWDKAIELKEKLIEEKKEFKKGLMQKLFTGEIRFPEFTGEWKKVVIEDIFEEVKRINDDISIDIDILTISAKHGFLSQRDKFSKVIAGSSLKKYTHLHQNEFAYNKGNSKTAPFGCIFKLDMKEGLVPFVYICFRPTQMIDVDFFDFYFKHGLLDRQLKRIITSGARSDGLLNVSKDNFFNIKISLPSIEEQKKIGFVLRLTQNEIDYSIAELNQFKAQKRGLMQLLLTGIVRVEVD